MRTIERYITRQLVLPVAGAVIAFTTVALLSQSLAQFDAIIGRGQSAWMLIKVTLYALPQLMGLILPMAFLIGTLVALNRMHMEQEFVACFTSGMSLKRVAAPIIRLAIIVSLLSLAVNLFIQPLASRQMREALFAIRTDVIGSLVREGTFSTSDSGLTIYVQHVDQNALLRQVFVRIPGSLDRAKVPNNPSDNSAQNQTYEPKDDRTYSAREGRILTRDGRSVMVMKNGSTQQFSDINVLNHTTFNEFTFDITDYFINNDFLHYKESDRYLHELLYPNMQLSWEAGNWRKLFAEGHARLASPLYNIAFALMAVVGVLSARFNRQGYGQRIGMVVCLAIVVRIIGLGVNAAALQNHWLNGLQYAVPLLPIVLCIGMIKRHDSVLKGHASGHSLSEIKVNIAGQIRATA
jgi:lipopolysaccharide export system permease protein